VSIAAHFRIGFVSEIGGFQADLALFRDFVFNRKNLALFRDSPLLSRFGFVSGIAVFQRIPTSVMQ